MGDRQGTMSSETAVRRAIAVAAMAALLCAGAARAQLADASLRGLTLDESGRALPGVSIVARHEATGQERMALTDPTGSFQMAGLAPGLYTILAELAGFRPFEQSGVRLSVGNTTTLRLPLPLAALEETVVVRGKVRASVAVSSEARLSDNTTRAQLDEMPMPQRDIFLVPRLSVGATQIPGAASSTKLSSSPVITVNGNRYRGNNYVLDGAMNTNPNNTGEPAIVPSLESVEEVEVQTLNFASEFGRGNGAVVNVQTRSGSNQLRGRVWEYVRNAALNARNHFATETPPQVYNQFGANLGGPLRANQTFFFVSYEGTRNAAGRPFSFLVETPELRDYVARTSSASVANQLFSKYPAPTPEPGSNGSRYLDQRNLTTPEGVIPAVGRTNAVIDDYVRFDQYMLRVDHTLSSRDRLSARWIGESQRDEGGTQVTSQQSLGPALRGERGPFRGTFGNLNLGYTRAGARGVNDLRLSWQLTDATRGNPNAVVPGITVTGLTAPFGDSFLSTTRLTTLELRDILSLSRGRHAIRAGIEVRRISKGLSIGPPTAGSFTFTSVADFIADKPFRQTLTVDPDSGRPVGFPRHFTQVETGAFVQDQWSISHRVSLSLGLRHDYFGTVSERDGLLSSITMGPGATFREQIADASIGRVDQLYEPELSNFSPRIGIAWDPWGNGRASVRAGFSMAYQPHHGQSIAGARALPPDAIQGVIQPSTKIGSQILYGIPVPFNPEFGRGLNDQGGVVSAPGEPPIRITGFVVNPKVKSQYTESWFLNAQKRIATHWIVEVGYVGTHGVNLERIEDANRFAGDLVDGREDRLNPNFGVLLFVTNGVSSRYDAFTAEVRHEYAKGFEVRANYRYSRWYDEGSDTSTGQFQDNDQPGKGAQDADCRTCEWGRSMFDIPHRLSVFASWAPGISDHPGGALGALARGWRISGVLTAQSGRPFSVWNGASFLAGGDYNADGGGGAVGGGYYDRPNAPLPGTIPDHFTNDDFLSGLFPASAFPKPSPGTNGTLGRNTFRGPRYLTLDLGLSRSFGLGGARQLELRLDAYNALNTLNLFLPNTDLSLSNFGKSTQAFDARTLQLGVRFAF